MLQQSQPTMREHENVSMQRRSHAVSQPYVPRAYTHTSIFVVFRPVQYPAALRLRKCEPFPRSAFADGGAGKTHFILDKVVSLLSLSRPAWRQARPSGPAWQSFHSKIR